MTARLLTLLILSAPLLPMEPGVAAAPGVRAGPTAAVLDQPDLPPHGMASSPEKIAAILQGAGFDVRRLHAEELADAKRFNVAAFDLLVLPTGAAFPVEARESMLQFLREGGCLITTGGYAFNHLVRRIDGQWRPEEDAARERLQQATRRENSLLPNGGFEGRQEIPVGGFSMDGQWRRGGEGAKIVADAPQEGRFCAMAHFPEGAPGGAHYWSDLPARPGASYQISGWMRTRDVTGRGMAFMAVYQHDAAGGLVEFLDFAKARATTPWQRYTYTFTPRAKATRLHLYFGLYDAHGTAWFDDIRLSDVTGKAYRPMNTSTGRPGDGLVAAPDQIGMFDASFPLKRARDLRPAAGQHILPGRTDLTAQFTKPAGLSGWAASGVVGYDHARWVPLLDAVDRFGRPRGAAGAMLIHYRGPFAGSIWAFFGLDNVDLFAQTDGPMAKTLRQIGRFMARKIFLRNLATEQRLYRPGEPVAASVVVENRGHRAQRAEVEFQGGDAFGPVATLQSLAAEVPPGGCQRLDLKLPPVAARAGLYEIRALLRLDGEPVDEIRSGFVVERPEVVNSGAPLRFAGNYFTLNSRPVFLFGSDDYSVTYRASCENPLTWAQMLTASRDVGLTLYENLQYVHAGHTMSDADWHDFAAMSQLVQERRMLFMPGMLIGHNAVVSDAELAEQSALCREYARRLGTNPGLLWYINGDYVLDPGRNGEAARELWNRWLTSEYGTTEKLRLQWGAAAVRGELGKLEFPPPNSGRWDDAAAVDRFRFLTWLLTRWNQAHVAAVREHDRQHPITSEYYCFPFGGIDLVQTIDGQDVSNIGYFDRPGLDIDRLPLRMRWNDLRARAKGVSLGEYGVKTHPAWTEANGATDYHIVRSEEEQKRLFLAVAHYGLGLGACKVQNWCVRDDSTRVFPWGMFYPNGLVPKDVAYAHRNQSLVWRHFRPVYRAPALMVCLGNQLRLGNDDGLGMAIGYRTFADLLALHYDFGTIDDDHLDRLPAATRALIYPSPLAMRDESYAKLAAWVRSGGTLLLTGDLSLDPHRRRTRNERLKELAGVEFVEQAYPLPTRSAGRDAPATFTLDGLGPQAVRPCVRVRPAGCTVLGTAHDGQPVLVRHALGRGSVFFFVDPIEIADDEGPAALRRQLYGAFLRAANPAGDPALVPLRVAPDEPWLHAMVQPTESGTLHVVYNTRREPGAAAVRLTTGAGEVELATRNGWPALAAVSRAKVVAATCDGRALVGGETVAAGHGLKALLSLDGEDLRRSKAIVVAPFEPGEFQVPATLKEGVGLAGDFSEGRWRTLQSGVLWDRGRGLLGIDEDLATCVILLCPPGDQARWTQYLTDAMARPDALQGY